MSETNLEQTESTQDPQIDVDEPGTLHIEEATPTANVPTPTPIPGSQPSSTTSTSARQERPGTVEHLAARRPVTPLEADAPEVKQRLGELRIEITRLLTNMRWANVSVQDTADSLIPLLDCGSFRQWSPVLLPFLLEIDRAGNLIPVWLNIIEQGDPTDLSPETNPAETTTGKARRIAILMLGYYKSSEFSAKSTPIGFRPGQRAAKDREDLYKVLGKLSLDPNISLYATQSLLNQGNSPAMQALISALKEAEGWAKVDIVETALKFNQPSFYDFLLASGFERAQGLENYLAVPIYRSVPLERYLRGGEDVTPRLSQQAALVFSQIMQDSQNQPVPKTSEDSVPVLFERDLSALANALFEGARRSPNWQSAIALHRLATLLGRYWADISRGALQDARIVGPVTACLPMMPEVERWMDGPGRDVLLVSLAEANDETTTPIVKVIGELREPRAISALLARVDSTTQLTDRKQAAVLGQICDALGRLGDLRAEPSLLGLIGRTVSLPARASLAKRGANLPQGDANIPASVIYGSVVRALGQLGDRNAFDFILRASGDFDPYVRTQALEALKRIDPTGEMMSSRVTAREALNDPSDGVVRAASQLVVQYRDREAIPLLQNLSMTRPQLAPAAYDALRQLG